MLLQFLVSIYFFINLTLLVSSQNACGMAGNLSPLIINGTDSKQGAWPWTAALYAVEGSKFICGGTLISTKLVTTAGHCIQGKYSKKQRHPTEIVVKLGKFDLSIKYERGSVIEYPIDILVHPDWIKSGERQSYDANIAMIIFESEVAITSKISPICLWNVNSEETEADKGIIVGWGKSESSALHENTPKELEVSIHSNEDCFLRDPRFAEISSRNTFCAWTDKESGPCRGDSGGGLFAKSGSRWYLKGIISSGFITADYVCDVMAGSLYTNVIKYISWINQIATDKGISLPLLL